MKIDIFAKNLLIYLHARMEFGVEPAYRVDHQSEMRVFVLPLNPYEALRDDFPTKTAQLLFHEIGHLLVAPKSRRNRADYGVPSGTVGDPYWDHDDNRASIIEHRLCRLARIPSRHHIRKLVDLDYWAAQLRVWRPTGEAMADQLVRQARKITPENYLDWKIVRSPRKRSATT